MNHITRRLTVGLVTAAVGSLAAGAALASPASAGIIVHDGSGVPEAAAYPPGPYAADYPPGPSATAAGSAIIPCL